MHIKLKMKPPSPDRVGNMAAHIACALGAMKGYGHENTAAAKSLQFVLDELMAYYLAATQISEYDALDEAACKAALEREAGFVTYVEAKPVEPSEFEIAKKAREMEKEYNEQFGIDAVRPDFFESAKMALMESTQAKPVEVGELAALLRKVWGIGRIKADVPMKALTAIDNVMKGEGV